MGRTMLADLRGTSAWFEAVMVAISSESAVARNRTGTLNCVQCRVGSLSDVRYEWTESRQGQHENGGGQSRPVSEG